MYATLSEFYPGGYLHWEILWIQNILLVFVQFTSGLALYEQDTRYFSWILFPFRPLIKRVNRRLLISIHVISGIFVVVLNVLCSGIWFYSKIQRGGDPMSLLFTAPLSVMGWTNVLVTAMILFLGVTGLSLYRNVTPSLSYPIPRLNYRYSKIYHRLFFVSLIAILGYHIFFFRRVTLIWMDWLSRGYLFGILAGLSVTLWVIIAGISINMIREWLTGLTFSKTVKSKTLLITLLSFCLALFTLSGVFLGLIPVNYGNFLGIIFVGTIFLPAFVDIGLNESILTWKVWWE